MLGLKLEPAPSHSAEVNSPSRQPIKRILVAAEAPAASNAKGVSISTKDFHRPPVDYEDRDRKNRKLGRIGEKLVFEYERARSVDRCWTQRSSGSSGNGL
jgi:hypothetical protein